jgi:hypothetical protein
MRTRRAVSLRVRLTLAFAGSMAVVLAGLAVFLYARLGTDLQNNIDLGLRARAGAIAAALRDRDPAPVSTAPSVIDPDESFAQVLDTTATIVAPSRPGSDPLLSAPQLRGATAATFFTTNVPGIDDPSRLLAVPVDVHGQHLVVVVGTNLGDKHDALHRLLLLLALGIPAAILLASGIGWVVAGAALRPLDAALAAERRFFDEASHDLRTPVGVLKAELDLALMRPRSKEELEQTLRAAAEQTDQLVRLTEDLLVHARTRRGPLRVLREPVALAQVGADCAAPFRTAGRAVAVVADDEVVSVDPGAAATSGTQLARERVRPRRRGGRHPGGGPP